MTTETTLGYGYAEVGTVDVLTRSARQRRAPGVGEVEIEVVRSGVNPTDVKSRRGATHMDIPPGLVQIPHHDGSGVVSAVGDGVSHFAVGQRAWVNLAAYRRLDGTAQQFLTIPVERVAPLPESASFELGATLGVPFLTAHRLLTCHQVGPRELAVGALSGATVLVAGGAGAVGNAAIQLARWAGAKVITTVSSARKQRLAEAAGADHVINYREDDVVSGVRAVAPDGVDVIVEVSPAGNATIDRDVLRTGGGVSIYANDGGPELTLPILPFMWLSASVQFVILYTIPAVHLAAGVRALDAAMRDRAIDVGAGHGLPILTYGLDDIAAAHKAVEDAVVGKVQLAVSGE
ncbi:NADPH:quinone reductase [Mycolicibacterium sp. CBMA 226]|uniref:NADPH:quinone reductase n=1 Tax=Mycolicibacterium sp. CBMA 226 TaxID=2606611 RepID=UPI0012DF2F00|nr:NADPH:quinone reductase [Mycolicibacterium sp. CBMA 226]MUL79007.1 NADPH:quinone reductase [Mycolicibacterium sp. CBMA 226]QGW61323.1 Quinone oxidoreductase 1 [Mycolicibacterium sp.]